MYTCMCIHSNDSETHMDSEQTKHIRTRIPLTHRSFYVLQKVYLKQGALKSNVNTFIICEYRVYNFHKYIQKKLCIFC